MCYGIGQLIIGIVGDRVNPFGMIAFGSAAGAVSCFIMSSAEKLPLMIIVWASNGFFQSMLWSPILRVFSDVIDKETGRKAILNISLSLPFGTVAAYFISTFIIKYYEWRRVFVCGGITAAAVTLFAVAIMIYVNGSIRISIAEINTDCKTPDKNSTRGLFKTAVASGLFTIMIPSFLHGMLRDGITNWVPAMLTEVYGVSASFSVFITIALPIFNAFGAYAAVPFYKRLGENEIKTAGIIGALSESSGWKAVIIVWITAAFITALVCLCKSKSWEAYIKSSAASIYFNE